MNTIWPGSLLARILPLAEYRHRDGYEADAEIDDPGTLVVEVAAAIAQTAAPYGLELALRDRHLAPRLRRDSPGPGDLRHPAVVVGLPDGRLGFTIGRGMVIESIGDALTIIEEPEPDRYAETWRLPGVHYGGSPA